MMRLPWAVLATCWSYSAGHGCTNTKGVYGTHVLILINIDTLCRITLVTCMGMLAVTS